MKSLSMELFAEQSNKNLHQIDASLLITRQPLQRSTAKKIQFSTFAIMNETNEQEEIAWKNQFHGYLLNNSTHSLTPPRKWLICCQHLPDVRIKINSSRWLYLVTSSSSTFWCLCRTLENVFNFWLENSHAWNDFGHEFRSKITSLIIF